jgi:hypothetical protein
METLATKQWQDYNYLVFPSNQSDTSVTAQHVYENNNELVLHIAHMALDERRTNALFTVTSIREEFNASSCFEWIVLISNCLRYVAFSAVDYFLLEVLFCCYGSQLKDIWDQASPFVMWARFCVQKNWFVSTVAQGHMTGWLDRCLKDTEKAQIARSPAQELMIQQHLQGMASSWSGQVS